METVTVSAFYLLFMIGFIWVYLLVSLSLSLSFAWILYHTVDYLLCFPLLSLSHRPRIIAVDPMYVLLIYYFLCYTHVRIPLTLLSTM